MNVPKLDNRNSAAIVEQALKLAENYLPEPQRKGLTDPNHPGCAMINIFARLMEILIARLNKIPEKNFLSFLDMVGVEQKPPSPAEVPVTFLLSKAAQAGGEIPGHTQVATTQTEKDDAQVFETRSGFFATPAQLKEVINLIPDQDEYSKLGLIKLPPKPEDLADNLTNITALSSNAPNLQETDHVLYLGSEALFGRKESIKITLTFMLSDADKALFDSSAIQWKKFSKDVKDWIVIENVSYPATAGNESEVVFDEFASGDMSTINEKEDFWISCEFIGRFKEVKVPKINEINGAVSLPTTPGVVTIDAVFSNNNPIDLSKPFFPFGERPKYGDAFYIGSKEAFSPNVAGVTQTFTILHYTDSDIEYKFQNMKAGTKEIEAIIKWQYLDDDELWQDIVKFHHKVKITKDTDYTFASIVHETYKNDDYNNKITNENGAFYGIQSDLNNSFFDFDIASDIGLIDLYQAECYWVRALITSSDPYGEDAYYVSTTNPAQPYVVVGPTFIPPVVDNFEITINNYKTEEPIKIESIQTKNNFKFDDHSEAIKSDGDYTFQPFIPITSHMVDTNNGIYAEKPAIYMGFDRPFGDVYISLFVHLKDTVSNEVFPLETGFPQIVWEYVSQNNGVIDWKPLDVQDGTANLTSSGTVAFLGPNDSEKIRLFDLITENELHWYRARLKQGDYDHPPEVKGIYLNTVMADNRMTIDEQVIGSGTGIVGQKLSLIRVPILSGDVWVKEPEKPNEKELKDLKNELEKDFNQNLNENDIQVIKENKDGEEIWVRWRNISNFHSSGPRSRHYTLDRISGELSFGNGERGLLPPVGKDNIIIKNYRTGGGEKANDIAVPLAVKELKSSLSYVDKVFNVKNAVGGSNFWTLDQTMEYGPRSIKNRNRVITAEDYEWMTLQEFSQLARVRCLSTMAPGNDGKLHFKPGAVTMTVIPKSNERLPQPSKGLLKLVKSFLMTRALGNIYDDNDVYVIGPSYSPINIIIIAKALLPEESSILERRIRSELDNFFHPLKGGEDKKGWEFGRDVYISEIYAVIERIERLDHVESIQFIDYPGQLNISIRAQTLVAAGSIEIRMRT